METLALIKLFHESSNHWEEPWCSSGITISLSLMDWNIFSKYQAGKSLPPILKASSTLNPLKSNNVRNSFSKLSLAGLAMNSPRTFLFNLLDDEKMNLLTSLSLTSAIKPFSARVANPSLGLELKILVALINSLFFSLSWSSLCVARLSKSEIPLICSERSLMKDNRPSRQIGGTESLENKALSGRAN
ncbi:hypothetical protein WICPIJ_007049 [Wickerhamomyces pijperi]|uniref:Uncharacterized protein n=1 Tax=Wickerhamomyces pijperi TaxID=599730 RepID=A0A9P8TJL6_WICPI|nr:hypothetical protein WICPIJ_007049 [Wickerhamomyces pijperi]